MEPWETDLRKALSEYEPEVTEEHWKAVMAKRRDRSRSMLPLYWRMAASIALLIGVAWLIRPGSEGPETTYTEIAPRNAEIPASPETEPPSQEQPEIVQRTPQDHILPSETFARKGHPTRLHTHRRSGRSAPKDPAESAMASQNLERQVEETVASLTTLPMTKRLEQRTGAVTAAGFVLPVPTLRMAAPDPTTLWHRLRQLPLFQRSDSTLPERTAETWAMLQPEGLHRLQDMARRPTTIEIIW